MKKIHYNLILTTALIALSCSLSFGQTTQSVKPDTTNASLLTHHLTSLQNNDLESVMSDYTNDSILVTPTATYKGISEIRAFFTEAVKIFPKQKSSTILDKTVFNGNLIYIVWHAIAPTVTIPFGSDTFIIKDNKIYQQTLFANVVKK